MFGIPRKTVRRAIGLAIQTAALGSLNAPRNIEVTIIPLLTLLTSAPWASRIASKMTIAGTREMPIMRKSMTPDDTQICRVIDANLNRAAEGLRVVEDYARFVLEDAYLTAQSKQLRHELFQVLSKVPSDALFAARDSRQDVGTTVTAEDEYRRASAAEIAAASQKRVEQALRCLEEYLKPKWPELAPQVEQLRYRAYAVARAISLTHSTNSRMQGMQLYVLLDGGPTPDACLVRTEQLIAAGVRLFQLRAKRLTDRELIERARELRRVTRSADAVLIVNDRPDIARLADADGVHLGQDELSVKDARSIVGPDRLIGVSTHTIEQARQAVLDGASYIGCGPTFPSRTKNFDRFSGTNFLTQVADELRVPAFAIGGIGLANVDQVIAAGFSRIAVSSAVAQDDCAEVAAELLKRVRAAVGDVK